MHVMPVDQARTLKVLVRALAMQHPVTCNPAPRQALLTVLVAQKPRS